MANKRSRFRVWTELLRAKWQDGTAPHKRTEITIESSQVTIIRRQRLVRAWCQECGCEVNTIPSSQANLLMGATRQASNRAKCHVANRLDGVGMVCLESLLSSMEAGPQKLELQQWLQNGSQDYSR